MATLDATATIWVLVIEHGHGRNITAHQTEESAHNALVAYCNEWWQGEVKDDDLPCDDHEAISRYFDLATDEFWEISKTTVEH